MEILLFGSTGLLGSHLLDEFLRRSWSVCAPHRHEINLLNLSQTNKFVGHWLCPRSDACVVYAAGLSDVRTCEANPDGAQHLNVVVPFLLANLCERVGARFVYFSTDQVFMNQTMNGSYLLQEDALLTGSFRTNQAYGASKAKGEHVVRLSQNNLVIRTSWLFGGHPSRSNFIKDVIGRAEQGESIMGLRDYVACPSYAPDVARATAQLLLDRDAHGTYHLVNGPAISRFEMAKLVLDHAGLKAKVHPTRQRSMGPGWIPRNPNGGLYNTRSQKLRPWTDGLDEYLGLLHKGAVKIPA